MRTVSLPVSLQAPVLALEDAVPSFDESGLPPFRFTLTLRRGDCALVTARDNRDAAALADLCVGLAPLRNGRVRVLGLDWAELDLRRAAALRARVGRIRRRGAWSDMLGTESNILLPQLHHTDRAVPELLDAAMGLARRFGLPGLPSGPPGRLDDLDLARAACVRAFLGRPDLLLLEPVVSEQPDLMPPLFDALTRARERGGAALCLCRDPSSWAAYAGAVTHHGHLGEDGLQILPHSPASGRREADAPGP